MALVVEDGTGLTTANGYATVAFVEDYLETRALHAEWCASSVALKEAAIVRATDYIERRFGGCMPGSRETDTQALSFPRDGYDGVPTLLQQATAEYAKRALSGELVSDPTVSSDGVIKRKKEKVGPLEEETEYFESSAGNTSLTIPEYPTADLLMKRLFALSTVGVCRGVYR